MKKYHSLNEDDDYFNEYADTINSDAVLKKISRFLGSPWKIKA